MSTPAGPRIDVVDVLRGAAMFGILAVNIWFFASAAINVGEPDFTSGWDGAGYGLALLLFASKSYLLFAFLFGYSFVLQSGPDEPARMRRRMVGLIAIGVLHGLLLFPGDILVTYGLLGFALIAMRGLPSAAAIRLGIRCTIASGVVVLLLGLLLALGEPESPPPGAAEALRRSYTGSFTNVLAANAGLYPSTLLVILLFQGLPALGAMLCGMGAARLDFLRNPVQQAATWRRLTPWAPVVGLTGAVAFTVLTMHGGFAQALLGLGVTLLTAPFLSATYVTLLVRWHRGNPHGLGQRSVAAVGRIALTNYLAQSLAMALVFSGYGLGLMSRLGALEVWLVVLAIYCFQVLVSTWWVGRHRYGPAELVLRRWTMRGRAR